MGASSFSLQQTDSLRSRADDLKACVYQPIKCLVSDQVSNGCGWTPVEQMKAVLTCSLSETGNLRAKLQSIAGNHTYNQPSNMYATYCPTWERTQWLNLTLVKLPHF